MRRPRVRRPALRVVSQDEFVRLWDRTPADQRRSYRPLTTLGYLSLWDGKAFLFVVCEATEVLRKLGR